MKTGAVGRDNQAIGLARAVGLPICEKQLSLKPPWNLIPGYLCPSPLTRLSADSDPATPPFPRLLIACGRRTIAPALGLKRELGDRIYTVYVQDPGPSYRRFDLVAAMQHDRIAGHSVYVSELALSAVTENDLSAARRAWQPPIKSAGHPYTGVLIGGAGTAYEFGRQHVDRLVAALRAHHQETGAAVLATPSRRTGRSITDRLAEALGGCGWFWLWDGIGDNPYLGILAHADRLVVSGDSISMVSEAVLAGADVHVLPLGGKSRRHDRFLACLEANRRITLLREPAIDSTFQTVPAANPTLAVAARIRQELGLKDPAPTADQIARR